MPKAKQQTKAAVKPRRAKKPGKHAAAMAQQVQQNKKALLTALERSLGVVTTACRQVGLDRTSHYRYLNDDAEYAAAVKEIEGVALDFAESKLHGLIDNSDTAATIFYLKTKGKKRGYIEKTINEHSGLDGEPIKTESNVNLKALSTEELIQLKALQKKIKA